MIFWGGFPLQYSRSQPRPQRGRHRGSKSKHAIRCFLARKKRIKRQQGQHVTTKHRQSTHAVIAEARAHTRYGMWSVVAVGYPRSPHTIPHICFCPSLTPLRFLRTLGLGGANNIAVISCHRPHPHSHRGSLSAHAIQNGERCSGRLSAISTLQ